MTSIFAESSAETRIVRAVSADALEAGLKALAPIARAYLRAAGFKAKAGETLALPHDAGADAVIGLGEGGDPFAFGGAAFGLGEGDWSVEGELADLDPTAVALAWAMGSYRFSRYKAATRPPARLVPAAGADAAEAERIAQSVFLARDLINTPAGDMGPDALQAAVEAAAKEFGAKVRVTAGDKLLKDNCGMIHAVGRAAHEAPRLIELDWGEKDDPRLVLVGKGVCFDSGGLDIKPADGMRFMKKDMGGAANALALARLVMASGLKVRLHLLIPAVENAISAGAFRPGDILTARNGLTVEIENTDAEGRLVLGDALAKATETQADLVLDFATLTGAARIALGAEVAPFYTDDDDLAAAIEAGGRSARDPVWRMPLWGGYDAQIDGSISDLKNTGDGPLGGSITAALFLRRFTGGARWAHFDIFAWNPKDRPGRPKGGEMQGARAAWAMLRTCYGAGT